MTTGRLAATLFLLALALPAAAVAAEPAAARFSEETVRLAETLPIQEGGRVKPLYTFARFQLLAVSGSSKYTNEAGEKIPATEWLLDCLFRPDRARTYRVFMVQDSAVLDAIQVSTEGRKKRDRYSYDEIAAGADRLMERAREYSRKEARDRSSVEEQTLALANSLIAVDELLQGLRPASPHGGGGSTVFAVFPPPGTVADRPEWLCPEEVRRVAKREADRFARQAELVAVLDELRGFAAEPAKFGPRFEEFHAGVRELADARGEYRKVPLEVTLYRMAFFHWSLGLFAMGFVFAALSWLLPRRKWVMRVPAPFLVGGAGMLTAGIVLRCIIRERPPVTTLYETILFITAAAVITALFIEAWNRRGIALAMAALIGLTGMFVANRYESSQGVDTMPRLVAVLDTNFWLATHVTTISLGYAAGLLAAAIAHVYILGRLFGLKRGESDFYRNISRMVYGVTCFGLLFSVVGTLLGGVWANESWGRFWGWDPKENGALMICLWMAAMLHAHLGGYIRDLGLCMAAVFGGVVVVFSWWGVNLLGVGLHSYGFTSGILRTLVAVCAAEVLVVLLGIPTWLAGRRPPAPPPNAT